MAKPRIIILLLLAFITIIIGTFLGLLPGLEALNSSSPMVVQHLMLTGVFYVSGAVLFLLAGNYLRSDKVEIEPSGSLRVVAIDDEADILRLIRIKLSKEGFEVSTASNGEEGVRKVVAEKPDVMIVDVMMPGKDGYQVVSEVKKKLGEEAPVAIMLTSKAEESDMKKGLSVGADDYITKPFSPSELIERINVALIKSKKH